MPQILPIKELKNTSEISNICHESEEPIFITKNGYGDMVLMSMETYEKKIARINRYFELVKSEEDIAEGRIIPANEVLERMHEKYGV